MSELRVDHAFAIVPSWVIELPISDRALRLYALLSAMRDFQTDQASYGRKLLAKKLRCSEDSLDRAKKELEEHGALVVERQRAARNVYTIVRVRPEASRNGAATGGARVAAPVRVETSRTRAATVQKELVQSSSSARAPKQVSGKKVTEREHDDVDALLARFNELAGGKRFAGREWRESIVRRMREHPDLPLQEHLELIGVQFKRPWWKGDPTPSVIWGNGRVFDRVLNGTQGEDPADDLFAGYTKA